jgi:hypothetical protein
MATVAENVNELTKTEDAVHASGDKGFQLLAVRNDALAALAGADGDYAPLQVGADGALYVQISDITPGTDATDLGKAEDAAHASGDVGVEMLAVRNDTLAALAGTDGDYAPLQVDANGALFVKLNANTGVDIGDVDVTSVSAGETHVGSVGGEATVVTVILSLHTDANVVNDVLAATQIVANAVRVNDGTGVIQSIVVQDDDDKEGDLDLIFFDANTSVGSESGTCSMADNDTILGIQEVVEADYVDMIGSQVATFNNVGIVIQGATGTDDIYMAAIARDTDTYTATGITIRLGILLD